MWRHSRKDLIDLRMSLRVMLLLALLAVVTVGVQGYHFGTDDAAIFCPAIERFAHPQLFPFGAIFFLTHSQHSFFAPLVGALARFPHLSVEWAVLLWYFVGTWLLLVAGWQMAAVCFTTARARWTAVALMAALLPVQVAGTAIPIADAYFTARTISTPLTLFALAAGLSGRWRTALVYIGITIFLHPQMALCAAVLLALAALPQLGKYARTKSGNVAALPVFLLTLGHVTSLFAAGPASGPYREALYARSQFFAGNWTLAQWVGVVCPMLILLWLSHASLNVMTQPARRISAVLVIAGSLATLVFLFFSSSHRFDSLMRLQPMRLFQLVYIVMFLLLGGLAGEYLLRGRVWRFAIFFLPLAFGMYALDRSIYPASPHLEWPGTAGSNSWLEAFAWIRQNTPESAVFAIDPHYMHLPGEDTHGFRALAERSVLADSYKDSGVAAMFPAVAPEWEREQQLTRGWDHYTAPDFLALTARSPVTWVMVQPAQSSGLDCPFHNSAVSVCRLNRQPSPNNSW